MEHLGKVLVVDDDHDTSTLLRMILERAGYEVREAYDADGGFERLLQWHPDLMVLDVMMHDGTEGFELVWKIRGQLAPPLSETPIIMLSVIRSIADSCWQPPFAEEDPELEEYLPVQAFLDKPTTPEALLREVRANVRRDEALN